MGVARRRQLSGGAMTMEKKVVSFSPKNIGWHHQFPHQVTPTLVTPLACGDIFRQYESSSCMKVIGSRSRSPQQKKRETPCIPAMLNFNRQYNSSSVKDVAVKFACSTWFSDTTTDQYIYILDNVPHIHVVWNHVATDKLTTANGETFTSRSVSLSSQSR